MKKSHSYATSAMLAGAAVLSLSLAACNTSHDASHRVPIYSTQDGEEIPGQAPSDNYMYERSTVAAQPVVNASPSADQQLFDSPEAAAQALVSAVSQPEKPDLSKIFGSQIHELVSGDAVQDKNNYEHFAEHAKEKVSVQKKGDRTATLYIGNDGWPFPIPIVQRSDGKWFFDTEAGKTEILARRIGSDELAAIGFMHAYVQAQRDYASKDHDGSQVLKYAQRLQSSDGKKDGLYWPSTDTADQSPFGPLVADASSEGYSGIAGGKRNPTPYHGYIFRILKAQGSSAPGGAYNYVINGNMIAGFALVAAPAEYGQSGIMTFIVSHQGKIYQKDFGPRTADNFKSMTDYNPDGSWTVVKE